MRPTPSPAASLAHSTVGLLLSGGLDSCVLMGHMLDQGLRVQPFYIRGGLFWEDAEYMALCRYLKALARPALGQLVVLDLPLADLYGDHWSLTGRGVPGQETPDEAVHLPGRNALLLIKASLWCQLHGIDRLALAILKSNPFGDATPPFFEQFAAMLNRDSTTKIEAWQPFASLSKYDVMQLGHCYPLELTFSCIKPVLSLHCGQCNKCAERRAAFRIVGRHDATRYAAESPSVPEPRETLCFE